MYKRYIILLLLLPVQLLAGNFDPVKELIKRRVPWLSGHVVFEKTSGADANDLFELQTKNNRLVIKASGANAAAVGLNWYLKNYCHRSMSHMGDNLSAVSPLPVVKDPVKLSSIAQYRYALNYCTYNYSMSFYTWKDWEHELDWMALNGVNTMLVANGEEAVWQNVLRRIGYSENEINDYITGPAYNAWWLMGNIQGWGGPMPQTQIDSRKELVQKMIVRMQSLGIEPVMPGFYGMVPSTLKSKIKAHIITQGNWGAFTRPDILDPTDTEFMRIAEIFYQETKRLYGKDIHFFSGDPFHEGGISEGVDLGDAGLNIQRAMQQYFPKSVWVLQGWQDNPKKELLAKLDKSTVLVQELFGENTNNWETRKGYEGTPFIWCMVNNFGERPGLQGKLERFASEVHRVSNSDYKQYMKGVGIMPEGINNNPVTYELLLATAWHQAQLNVSEWVHQYAISRYGKYNKDIADAWDLLLQTTYSNPGYQEGPPENILCARPALQIKSVSSWGNLKKGYDTAIFEKAVQKFASAAPLFTGSETYQIDLINFSRQVLSNKADVVFTEFVKAYNDKNLSEFKLATAKFLQLADETDALLSAHPYFRLSTYQQQAIASGNTMEEQKNNLHNAMMLITYWGENNPKEDNLHEYAYKEWSGLMTTFYKKRWEMYFEYLTKQMEGKDAVAPDFFQWERNWVAENETIQDVSSVNPFQNKWIDYRELTDPRAADKASWEKQTSPVSITFADVDKRYPQSSAPDIDILQENWEATGWKGEKLHTQFLISTKNKLKKVSFKPENLIDNKGNSIPTDAVTTGFVRSVWSDGLNKEGHGCGIAPAAESDSSLVADGIDFIPEKGIEAYTTQAVWLSIAVPQNTGSGEYKGDLQINVDGKKHLLHYKINVKPYILPSPKDWQFHLDLWQNPYAVSRLFNVPDWSKEHLNLMRPYMQMLANAGQKTITVSMIYDPWRGQTHDIYKSMIRWIRKKDGSWEYDYSIFDKWVGYMMIMGVDKLINCYTMVPWNNKFYYFDESTGRDTLLVAKTGTPEFDAHWKPMLTDFAKHLKQKGWFAKTAIAMDERPLDDMQKVIALVKSVDPDFKISLAGSYHAEIAGDIYDYCVASSENFDKTTKAKRVAANLPTTFYTYCYEGKPNTFTFSPPAESAWMAWYAAAQGYNGYLRWAYNCWPKSPMQDARFSTWSSGDTYLIYPGGSSIRFERLIEGIQDYEKIRILKTDLAKKNELQKLMQLETAVNEFSVEALDHYSAADMLQKAKAVLNSF